SRTDGSRIGIVHPYTRPRMRAGTVVLIGGAEDKVRERVILTRFVTLAGAQKARIVVVTTASIFGAETGARYRAVFEQLGAGRVETVDAATRADAQDLAAASTIAGASGIFLAGGNQLR